MMNSNEVDDNEINFEKCGEILVRQDEENLLFAFTCAFCDKEQFIEVEDFICHFKCFHTNSCTVIEKLDPLESEPNSEIDFSNEENLSEMNYPRTKNLIIEKQYLNSLQEFSTNTHEEGIVKTKKERNIEKKFSCDICDRKYSLKSSLRKHIKKAHSSSIKSKNHEKIEIDRFDPLDLSNDNNDDIRIRNEEYELLSEEGSVNHENIEQSDTCKSTNLTHGTGKYIGIDENGIFYCKICYKKYNLKKSLYNHIRSAHVLQNTNRKRLSKEGNYLIFCKICGKRLNNEYSLQKHQEEEHNLVHSDITLAETNQCEEILSDDESKKKDVNVNNSTISPVPVFVKQSQDSKTCRYCSRKFRDSKGRRNHERTHSGERPYKCKYCEKFFPRVDSLRLHERVHEGVKPYKCTMCDKAFASGSNLTQHIKRHLGIKTLPCQYCGKLFQQNTERKSHERTHTGEKPFQCTMCGECFLTSEILSRHINKHTNNRRYKCDQCDRRFFVRAELRDHMTVHTGERPHKCEKCNATFTRKKSLRDHIKNNSCKIKSEP